MSSDEDGKSGKVAEVVQATTALVEAVPVYQDGLQDGVKQVGAAVNTVGGLANLALRPVKSATLVGDLLFDRLDGWLREKLAGEDEEKITEPPPYVAGNIAAFLPFVEDTTELREMFVHLLANAMHVDRQRFVHPAYSEIVRQLTPAEARIIESLHGRVSFPVMEARLGKKSEQGWNRSVILCDLETWLGCDNELTVIYLKNMERLRIIEIDFDKQYTDKSNYDSVRDSPTARQLAEEAEANDLKIDLTEGVADLTAFGIRFIRACTSMGEDNE